MAENLDLVRSIIADWERGDFRSAQWADSEIEYVVADGPSPGKWTGLAGMAEGSRASFGVWDDWRLKADEFRELDDERVLVLLQASGRGKTSGLDVGSLGDRGAALFEMRGGKVVRHVAYWSRDRALGDLSLVPEAD